MAYLKHSRLSSNQLAANQPADNQPVANQFCWTAQLISFAPGRTSSRQAILVKVACVHYGDGASLDTSADSVHAVYLGKAVRRMMMGYLSPSDWVRVVGKYKVDVRSGELMGIHRGVHRLLCKQ